MTYTPERAAVNQTVQIGAEALTALGTAVAAGKLLTCYNVTMGIEADVIFYTATGHKYATSQEENMEWTTAAWSGTFDYNGVIYPLQGPMCNVGAVAHGNSATAYDWIFAPPITGTVEPQTYTIQQGDSVRAQQMAYGLFTDFGYKGTRKEFNVSAKMVGQKLSDGITKTASPTTVALAPVVANQVNVFLDSSQANLGTTQLLRVLSIDYDMSNVFAPLWVLNRSTPSFTTHVDTLPKTSGKLKVEADANGMAMLGYLQTGTTYYLQVDAQGVVIDNLQIGTITGGPTGGTFTLTYKAQTTAGIAYNATGATVQTAFRLLSTVPATTTVTGGAGGPYSIIFTPTSALSQDTTAITASGAGLTGGSSPAITIAASQSYNEVKHQMAIKFGKPSSFSDDSGVFAIEWEYEVVEDSTWGHSQILTVTNLLASL